MKQSESVPDQLSASEPVPTTGTVRVPEPVRTNTIWPKPIFFFEPIWPKPIWSESIWSEAKRWDCGLFCGRSCRNARLCASAWQEEEKEGDHHARAGEG